jgi:hypothetical protein
MPFRVESQMNKKILQFWQSNPLVIIMLLAAILRLLAAIFSRGYAMSDDHFVVIHNAQRWLDGYRNWFAEGHPAGFSLVYPGLHYILFYMLKMMGIINPEVKMMIVRLLHAGYSLLTVYFGYKITMRISNRHTANMAGLLLAAFWIMPFMSVRNLIEMVCIPPMMAGYYLVLKTWEDDHPRYWLSAGVLFGVAFAFRYQSVLIPAGILLVLLFRTEWKRAAFLVSGLAAGMFLLQGIVDWIAWGYPFAALLHYTVSNVDTRYEYITGEWYRYVLLLAGIFIPPVSLFFMYGYARMWKRIDLLFWPTLLFLVFHSVYPNKQERFILPILPFFIIIGLTGWQDLAGNSEFWRKHKALLKNMWIWFWTINTVLLIILTFTYSKKSLVEPMNYLRGKNDLAGIIIEYNHDGMPWFPRFYLGREVPVYRFTKSKSDSAFLHELHDTHQAYPNYVFFFGNDDLQSRVVRVEKLLNARLECEKIISPSIMDDILHRLNPAHNLNLTSAIYKISEKDGQH